jgi:hypothetical protein
MKHEKEIIVDRRESEKEVFEAEGFTADVGDSITVYSRPVSPDVREAATALREIGYRSRSYFGPRRKRKIMT